MNDGFMVPREPEDLIADVDVGSGTDDEHMPPLAPLPQSQPFVGFEGCLVEIYGLRHTLKPEMAPSEWRQGGATMKELPVAADFNGEHGRVVALLQGQYLIHTLGDVLVRVPSDNLRAWEPPCAEDGGFDLVWPSAAEHFPEFTGAVTSSLAEKGWCVVQMIMSDSRRAKAVEQAASLPDYSTPQTELLTDYMGRDGSGKQTTFEEVMKDEAQPRSPLFDCTAELTDLMVHMEVLSEHLMGFNCWSRSKHHVWSNFVNTAEEREMRPKPLSETDVDSGKIEDHLIFIQRRRICMMHLIDNAEEGDIWLFPRKDLGWQNVYLPVTKGKLLLFRHDLMSFSCKPSSSTAPWVALQTWILDSPQQLVVSSTNADYESRMRAIGIEAGLGQPMGDRVHIMSLMTRLPGGGCGASKFTTALLAGADTEKRIPRTRFDASVYCVDDLADGHEGKSMTAHGAFCSDKEVFTFDNEFFNIPEDQVLKMAPCQRVLLEVGYQCLNLAGHTRASLKNHKCGVYVGDCGSDVWPGLYGYDCGLDMSVNPHSKDGTINFVTSSRLSHCLGLTGPVVSVDTACSSSLVATDMAMRELEQTTSGDRTVASSGGIREAMPVGITIIISPYFYVTLSLASMFSATGRCLTFDSSGNGYARGEGCGTIFLKASQDQDDIDNQIACLMGTCINQDGRSATLTAPNGPSQQQCIRQSLEHAGLSSDTVTMAECHGTGTALGDPIEVGALRNVLQDTDDPILLTSAKCSIGHLEAGAGMAGLQKLCVTLISSIATPNVHLRQMNSHLNVGGFPALLETEVTDTGMNSGAAGVSSFGFGGTNARGDVWAQCQVGPKRTGPLDVSKLSSMHVTCPITMAPIDWLTGEPPHEVMGEIGSRPNVLRDEFASYDISSYAYDGGYRYRSDPLMELEQQDRLDKDMCVGICGSWSGWSDCQTMHDDGGGWYSTKVCIGEGRCEMFHLCLDMRSDLRIYPSIDKAHSNIWIFGPDDQDAGRKWIIDGRDAEVPAQTHYLIRFRWGVERKYIKWEKQDTSRFDILSAFRHTYSVIGSWTAWQFYEMTPDENENGLWRVNVKIGPTGKEEFQFARDRDWRQVIYPAKPRTSTVSVPVRGPDDMGNGKNWLVHGSPGDVFTIQLQIVDAKVIVNILSETSMPNKEWHSREGYDRHEYFVSGSFNDWTFLPMLIDPQTPGVFKCRGSLPHEPNGVRGFEARFRIVVDEDFNFAYYPLLGDCDSGKSIVQGPDEKGNHDNWLIVSGFGAGAIFEISLDLSAVDRRQRVTWRFIDEIDRLDE